MLALEISGVSKSYPPADGTVPIDSLREVKLDLRPSEFVAVIGPSGCGKSTLLNLIAGVESPTSGEIHIHGKVRDSQLGVVAHMPQRDLLLPWRCLLDNVMLGPEIQGGSRREARREAIDLLPRFGLEGFARAYPRTLSGGMRQRAALLRTILMHRNILLLDEPFGALDALTRGVMQEWLLKIWSEFKKSILFVTHDVDEAVFLADRVYVMTRRPGAVKLEVSIDLVRPRTRSIRLEPAFIRAKQELLESLMAEAH